MPAATERQLEYDHLDGDKVVYKFEPKTTSGTFQLQTAHFYEGKLVCNTKKVTGFKTCYLLF